MRACGLNFRDVLTALGMFPVGAPLGAEGAGVVVEVGAGVTGFAPGDRVFGLIQGAFGPVATVDARLLAHDTRGLVVHPGRDRPAVFTTAYHALVTWPTCGPASRC